MLNESKNGWFILPRELLVKVDDPTTSMCDYAAFVWLFSNAAFADYEQIYRGKAYKIQRGQLPYSVRKLKEKFCWSKDRVTRFLNKLEEMKLIKTQRSPHLSILTICNYCEIQDQSKTNKTHMRTQSITQSRTQMSTSINNKIKKQKKAANNFSIHKDEKLQDWQIKMKDYVDDVKFTHWILKLDFDGEYAYCLQGQITYCKSHLQSCFQKAFGNDFKGFKEKE